MISHQLSSPLFLFYNSYFLKAIIDYHLQKKCKMKTKAVFNSGILCDSTYV